MTCKLARSNTAGAADGSIIPIIITIHIAQSNRRCTESHLSVIIHADRPVMLPCMSSAIGTIQPQQAVTIPVRTNVTRRRSDRNNSSAANAALLNEQLIGKIIGVRNERGLGRIRRCERLDSYTHAEPSAAQVALSAQFATTANLLSRSFVQALPYASWKRHQRPFSLRPCGARSSHWYIPQRPSSPRA